jgi:hypothetical protein
VPPRIESVVPMPSCPMMEKLLALRNSSNRRLRPRADRDSQDAHHEKRDVVVLRPRSAKLRGNGEEALHDGRGGGQRGGDAFVAELPAIAADLLGEAVAGEEQRVAGEERSTRSSYVDRRRLPSARPPAPNSSIEPPARR